MVGTLGGAVASRTSVEGPTQVLSDAQHEVHDDTITIQAQTREGARSLHMHSDVDTRHHKPEEVGRCSRASIVEHLHEIERNPIQKDEIDSLLESDSSMYYELVPQELRSSIVLDSRMFEFGRELLSRDPELASTMSRSLASMLMVTGNGHAAEAEADSDEDVRDERSSDGEEDDRRDREEYVFGSSTILHSQHDVHRVNQLSYASVGATLVQDSVSETSLEWLALRQQYPCTICQDVMCAPHLVVECAHSFCGACIQEHIQINSQDCDMVCCPKCRHAIERAPCYEPDFDARILADVENAPDCESKWYWMEKRDVVLERLSRKRRLKSKKDRSQQSTASWLWETVKENMAGIIGVVALILIVVAARRSGR